MVRSASETEARPFNCATCPKKIQKLRRCMEDRWDFTSDDSMIFPMQIANGGALYSFCPAKSTWDLETRNVFNILMISAETGQLYRDGGIINQPEWFITLLSEFIPVYDKIKFTNKAQMILGDGKKQTAPSAALSKMKRGR